MKKECVLFGYDKNDIDKTGYYSVSSIVQFENAHRFPLKTSKKWLKFINEDPNLNHGYEFHIIKVKKSG